MKIADFRDKFFPLPTSVSSSDQPQWDGNMFKGLENTQDMVEAKIAEDFVSRHSPTSYFTAHRVFLRLGLSSPEPSSHPILRSPNRHTALTEMLMLLA